MNNFLKIFILITIVLTVVLIYTKPQMHNRVQIEGSGFILQEDNGMGSKTTYEYKPETVTTVSEQKKNDEPITFKSEQIIASQVQNTPQKIITQQEIPSAVKITKQQVQEVSKPQIQKQETKSQPAKNQLTKEEKEIIEWNVWRSNIQNNIMKDSKITGVPEGTIFRFSFTVDKNGRISNIKAWSDDSTYTNLAILKIKPVIQSYQGSSLLIFPSSSERVITNVQGGYKIVSSQNRFSTPEDYNDYEKK